MISASCWKALTRELHDAVTDETIREAVAKIRRNYTVSPLDLVDALRYFAHIRYGK